MIQEQVNSERYGAFLANSARHVPLVRFVLQIPEGTGLPRLMRRANSERYGAFRANSARHVPLVRLFLLIPEGTGLPRLVLY